MILASVSDTDRESAKFLTPAFVLASKSDMDIEDSVKVLKKLTNLDVLSLTDVLSVNVLFMPCALASKSPITISPPGVVSNTALSNMAESNLVRYSSIVTV